MPNSVFSSPRRAIILAPATALVCLLATVASAPSSANERQAPICAEWQTPEVDGCQWDTEGETPTTVTSVELEGDTSGITYTLPAPDEPQDVLADLALDLGANSHSQVEGDTLVVDVGDPTITLEPMPDTAPVTEEERQAARPEPMTGSTFKYTKVLCDRSYLYKDAVGTFSIQRSCSLRLASWSFRFSPAVQKLPANGYVNEIPGMRWSKDFVVQSGHQNSPHPNVPAYYFFHGGFNGIGAGQFLQYYDTWYWLDKSGNQGGAWIKGDLLLLGRYS